MTFIVNINIKFKINDLIFSNQISKIFTQLDSAHREDSNDMCFISVALILTELFMFKILY
jgi:hypothetical protein